MGDEKRRGSDEDPAVRSEPIDLEEGGTVVISQQNAGPGNQVGDGEFKPDDTGRTVEEAAEEQAALEEEQPVD
jgi:hypothetical protein